MLSKAIKHANWTLTNEYPPFYHVKKSTSKIVVQQGRRENADEGGRGGPGTPDFG